MTVIQGPQGSSNGEFSRRDFMKLGGAGLGTAFLSMLRGVGTQDAQALTKEKQGALPYFEISGVPASVNKSDVRLKHANETILAPGDVIHRNEIGLGTEHFLAEPGVYTTHDFNSKDLGGSTYLITPDTQVNFTQPGPSFFGPIEGGFNMYIGAYMKLTFGPQDQLINIQLGSEDNHSWMVIVKGQNRDYTTPDDLNTQIKVDKYNPGFTLGTRLPPGQYVSEDYFEQNVATTQGKNCGADGCHKVSTVLIDATTGAYTVIEKDGPTAQWTQYKTNIK